MKFLKIASLDVDPQKGFTPLCPNELPVPGGHEIVEELNKNHKHVRIRAASKDWHSHNAEYFASGEHPQFEPIEHMPDADMYWNAHCVAGTKGAEFLDGLDIHDFVVHKGMEVTKHPYGALYHDLAERQSTGLHEYFQYHDINTVIVGGLATDYCVKTTVFHLINLGYIVLVNLAACRAVTEETGAKAIKEMKEDGAIMCTNAEDVEQSLYTIRRIIDTLVACE